MQLGKIGAEAVFQSSIVKDIFAPVAKFIIGFITAVELYYLFINKFSVTPVLLQQITQLNISFVSLIFFALFLFIIGYVTCILGLFLLNFFAFVAVRIFNPSFYEKFLPVDPSTKGYDDEKKVGKKGYYTKMFEDIVEHLKLNYSAVGGEFLRLCSKLAVENENIFKPHIISFDTTLLRGLFMNSWLLVTIAIINGNLLFIVFSILLLIVIYIENKSITEARKQIIYDLAYLTVIKENKKKIVSD